MMKEFLDNSYLFGANAPFIEELYENYLANPAVGRPRWRDYFDQLQLLPGAARKDVAHAPVVESLRRSSRSAASSRPRARCRPSRRTPERKQVAVLQLITAYRIPGSRCADVDPLKRMQRPHIPELEPGVLRPDRSRHGHGVQHRARWSGPSEMTLREILPGAARDLLRHHRRRVHVHLRQRAEALDPGAPRAGARHAAASPRRAEAPSSSGSPRPRRSSATCTRATSGRSASRCEGGESLIPLLDTCSSAPARAGVQELVIGMAHRGRLNVLVNTLGKMPKDLFARVRGQARRRAARRAT